MGLSGLTSVSKVSRSSFPTAAQDGDLADAVAKPGGEAGGFDIQEGEGGGNPI
jgi:hypothetical protein